MHRDDVEITIYGFVFVKRFIMYKELFRSKKCDPEALFRSKKCRNKQKLVQKSVILILIPFKKLYIILIVLK